MVLQKGSAVIGCWGDQSPQIEQIVHGLACHAKQPVHTTGIFRRHVHLTECISAWCARLPLRSQILPDLSVEFGNLGPVLVIRVSCVEARQGLFQAEACLQTRLLNKSFEAEASDRLRCTPMTLLPQVTRARASFHPPHTRPKQP